jgi:hypothetical protein
MPMGIRVLAIMISIAITVVTLELIRREKLRERYSLLWLATAVSIFILACWSGVLDFVAGTSGVKIPSNALFFIGNIFLMLIVFHLTIVISELSRKNDRLTQEIALIKKRMESLENGDEKV